MLILLSGPDDYRREAEKKKYIEAFVSKYPEAIRGRFDFEGENQVEALAQFLGSQSLFASIKLAVLEHASVESSKRFVELIREAVPRKDAVLVIGDAKSIPESIRKIAKKYEGKGKEITAKEFDYLEGRPWQAFVSVLAEKEGAVLADDALEYFSSRYYKDTWGLVTELRKVSTLGKKPLTRKDVELLDTALAPDFFGLLGGLKGQRLSDRLTALERMFASGGAPAKFFNVLAYSGPDFVRRFAEYDVLAKSGRLEYEELLLDSVL